MVSAPDPGKAIQKKEEKLISRLSEDQSFEGFRGRVFPVLGLKDKVQVRTNFGTDPSKPFKWIPQTDQDVAKQDEKLVNGE